MARVKVEELSATSRAICSHCSKTATLRLSVKVGRKVHDARSCPRHKRLAKVLLTKRANNTP